jgi:hypothetical protein
MQDLDYEFNETLEEYPSCLEELEDMYAEIATPDWNAVIQLIEDDLGAEIGDAGREVATRLKMELVVDKKNLTQLTPIEFDEYLFYLLYP